MKKVTIIETVWQQYHQQQQQQKCNYMILSTKNVVQHQPQKPKIKSTTKKTITDDRKLQSSFSTKFTSTSLSLLWIFIIILINLITLITCSGLLCHFEFDKLIIKITIFDNDNHIMNILNKNHSN